jgi:hypothetical protein
MTDIQTLKQETAVPAEESSPAGDDRELVT